MSTDKKLNKSKNILVISPHMDDEVLGLGGTIARHVEHGDIVHVVFVAHRIYNHKYDEAANKAEEASSEVSRSVLKYHQAVYLNLHDERLNESVQDIIINLEKVISDSNPHTVYIPFYGDNHQDHRAVFDAARVALRASANPNIVRLLMYETPSSTEQSPPIISQVFSPNYYVNINSVLDIKIKALSCYTREARVFPHPRSEEGIIALARKRGTEIGFLAAEAFMILRDKWK